jgi:hypothetical protein
MVDVQRELVKDSQRDVTSLAGFLNVILPTVFHGSIHKASVLAAVFLRLGKGPVHGDTCFHPGKAESMGSESSARARFSLLWHLTLTP